MTTPFTYCITHIPSGRRYYGVRFKKGCHPSDLWDRYFTSSKRIHSLIEQDGIHSFKYEIRKTFETKEKAIYWERRVLIRLDVVNNDNWINENVGTAFIWTDNAKLLHSQRMTGNNNPFFGRTHSPQTKLKMSKSKPGHPVSEDHKKMLSELKKGKPFSGYGGNDPKVRERARQTMIGMKRSMKAKENMRNAAKGRKWKLDPVTGKRIFYRPK